MRILALSIGLLALATPLVAAWSKEDREIFRVRDELIAHEGPDVTFYEFLGVPPAASQDDISKAYRKRARALHPDKVKQQLTAERAAAAKASGLKKPAKPPSAAEVKAAVKLASERQARLSIVANVLRSEGRDRYDHFLAHGFPTWKGTEYYYSRYRPGLGTAVFGVFLVAGGAVHYIALYMSWKRQREFVERYIRFARRAAWGERVGAGIGIPGLDDQPAAAPPPQPQMYEDEDGRAVPVNRKIRRMQERDARKEALKEASGGGRRGRKTQQQQDSRSATPRRASPAAEGGPTGAKKRVVAENGKVLVVDSLGDVYLEEEDEEGNVAEFLLDLNELHRPTFRDTAVVRLPLWAYRMSLGRFLPKPDGDDGHDHLGNKAAGEDGSEDSSEEPGKATPSTDSAEDFELLENEEGLEKDKAKATGSGGTQQKQGKSGKRKGKKR